MNAFARRYTSVGQVAPPRPPGTVPTPRPPAPGQPPVMRPPPVPVPRPDTGTGTSPPPVPAPAPAATPTGTSPVTAFALGAVFGLAAAYVIRSAMR